MSGKANTAVVETAASPHQLILASAGTGKTYRLTNHYVGLVLSGVAPERILATTFTRKAAGEILGRILELLADAVRDENKRKELAEELPEVNTESSHILATLVELTRNLDRFQVRTLDAFFAHLGSLFGLDLGLPAGWAILEEREAREQYAEAIGRLLEGAEGEEWVELLRHLQRAAARRTHEAMLATVGEVRALWLESGAGPWDWLTAPEALEQERLATALDKMDAAPPPLTQAGAPHKRWVTGHATLMENARARDWSAVLSGGPVKSIVEGKTSYSGATIPDEVIEAWEVLKQQAAHVLLGEIVRQNAATVRFMSEFEQLLAELRSEEGGLRFEDLPRALAPGGTGADADADDPLASRQLNMWFRLDGRLDHLLLDEFQDTSPLQWRVLARLAEEVLSCGEMDAHGNATRSFFCVGDGKQSIYGWRGAEPALLEGLGGTDGRFPVLEPEHLEESYRSAPLILDTVNRVFSELEGCPAFVTDAPQVCAARAWLGVFKPHVSAKKQLPGSASLFEAPYHEENAERVAAVLDLAVERVVSIVAEEPAASVALLLRRRMHIAPLIHRLAAQGIRASDQGGNPLTDSGAVVQILSLLHLADHPGDTMAAFHVATCPLGAAIGLAPKNMKAETTTIAAAVRARIIDEGLGAFVGSFTAVVHGATEVYGDWDRRRFGQLVDLAQAFSARGGLRPTAFVEHVRETNVEDTSASRVKVMTIHGAKGLEFDAVVLPELDESLILHQPRLLASQPDVFGPVEVVTHSPKRAICRLDDELLAIREERETREIRESLCLLYVAMTRAIYRLEMVVRGEKGERKNTTGRWSSLLCHALGSTPGENGLLWSHQDNADRWRVAKASDMATADESGTDEADSPPPAFRLAPTTRPRSLPRRAPSAAEGGPGRRAADLLNPTGFGTGAAMALGTLVHHLLEEVIWLEDFQAEDEQLDALLTPHSADASERAEAIAIFRSALGHEALRAALSRPTGDGDKIARVENERAFAVELQDEDGAPYLMNGFIDRLVIVERDGSPVSAEIVDHKTDAIDSDRTLAQRTEHYRPQLDAYRTAVASMLGLAPDTITCRLLFLRTGAVVDL